MKKSLLVSIPHSGEKVPTICDWLIELPEEILMCDVDRFVDQLYLPALTDLEIPVITTEWHRYAIDLNRLPTDIDAASVRGHFNPVGTFKRGLHWTMTTTSIPLMKKPLSLKDHTELLEKIYFPYHQGLSNTIQSMKKEGERNVYHLDLHSMPSLGTSEHRDEGQHRSDVAICDCEGGTASKDFTDLVINSYQSLGFTVSYNWPYKCGRTSQTYGNPRLGVHSLLVELNRSLYMDEKSKRLKPEQAQSITRRLDSVIKKIFGSI